jgi:hypothetical protein
VNGFQTAIFKKRGADAVGFQSGCVNESVYVSGVQAASLTAPKI